MENEIRPLCPIVYYHVWDNYPYPMFNKKFYDSNDHIVSISRVTDDIVRNVSPDVSCTHIPHAVRGDLFISNTTEERTKLREQNLPEEDRNKFIVFWNNRNARRKQSGTLLWWWKEWLDERGLHDKAQLIMHTDPKDVHGQDLNHIIEHLGMTNRQVLFSTKKVDLTVMPTFYNMADVTINISDAEGFGLATLESLSCGTPIIATMTGGLQEQVISPEGECGIPIFPSSRCVIGSQQVPYIYEDRISSKAFKAALTKMYKMSPNARTDLGLTGHRHVKENYNFEQFNKRWVSLMTKIHEDCGSWETRKNYTSIKFEELK